MRAEVLGPVRLRRDGVDLAFPAGQIGRLLQLMHEIDHNGLKGLLAPLRRPR